MRAFVGGESLWSKSQKESVYYLSIYARTHAEADYQHYTEAISVPLGDHRARLELDRTPFDIAAARDGLLAGKNNVEDVDGMIRLYRLFHHTSLLHEPVTIWTEADQYIAKLHQLALKLHAAVINGHGDEATLRPLLDRINEINLRLPPLEVAFSNALGRESRTATLLIYGVMLGTTAILLALGTWLSRRIVQRCSTAMQSVQENELRLRAMIESAMDAVVSMDAKGCITRWSGQAQNIFGWSAEDAIGQPLHDLIIPLHLREAHVHGLRKFMTQDIGPALNRQLELLSIRRDGSEFPVELTITPYKWGGQYEFTGFIRDITRRKHTAEQMQHLAHYDSVTQLPNRVLFQDRLEQEIKRAQRNSEVLALMFLDIDHFKEINDTLGHGSGDLMLQEAAHRLLACVRNTDTVARMGGDEFMVVLPQLEDANSIERVAQVILRRLAEPFQLEHEVVHVTISIGITLFPQDAETPDVLVKNADQAMYLAKRSGRNRFSYFTPIMQQTAQTHMRLAMDLHNALAGQQLCLHYQPIVSLATGDIHKAEALIRWQHPSRGMVSPAEFIPIAEETGLIIAIGDWVFHQAVYQAAQWRKRYRADFQISINKSPAQFQNTEGKWPSWPQQLTQFGLPGESIVAEITEGLLMDLSETTQQKLIGFRDAGIQVALDDFGTGYSSLSYLNRYDIDYIKIDQSFVRNIRAGADEMVLCEAIILMAHKLGIQAIAEGVETAAQRDLLTAAGCDYAQGYLFSKPVPAAEFELLLRQSQAMVQN